ncbi:MAG: hypothetical protein HGA31_05725 [Candidatus Moranbacteria bacterium]|nr:hypothetical protein [Candidatus Moranbacteria bacterium]
MSGILDDVRAVAFNPGENRETFFNYIAEYWPRRSKQYKKIKRAYDYAKDGFRDKFRKDNVTRYFEHPRAATLVLVRWLGIIDPDEIVEMILHDNPEDLDEWTLERCEGAFSKKNARGLERLTKLSEEDGYSWQDAKRIYYQWFETAGRKFFRKKNCDRLVNILTSDVLPLEKQEELADETERYFIPYAKKFGVLYQELLAGIKEIRERVARIRAEQSLSASIPVPEA